jgi:transcriptional regulator with XRE-family HTH domain
VHRDVEKLKAARTRLKWNQKQMADAIGLDRSYLSQLENGERTIRPWILDRVEVIEREQRLSAVEKSMSLAETSEQSQHGALLTQCREHLNAFLETCEDDAARIGWTLVELRRKFPLDYWAGEPEGRTPVIHGLSSTLSEKARSAGRVAASKVLKEHGAQSHSPKPPAHDSTEDKP